MDGVALQKPPPRPGPPTGGADVLAGDSVFASETAEERERRACRDVGRGREHVVKHDD